MKFVLFAVLGWLIISSLYAYNYVVTILSSPGQYDAYAMNWQFQLLMFSLFRLPWLVLVLAVVVGVIVVLPMQIESPVHREMCGT
ncbi:MAG TPA: hypothetical protein VJU86_06350 [Pyrinomonadaceae bacterium]|nr:hypothetical protein [Pyrinomonadaceae bacterium]